MQFWPKSSVFYIDSRRSRAYSADNSTTPLTASNHVSSTITHLSCAKAISPRLHKIPVCSTGSISKRVFGIRLYLLVLTVQSRDYQLSAELEEIDADLTAGQRQGIEGVQVNVGGNRGDDSVF